MLFRSHSETYLARNRVEKRGLDTEEWDGSRAGLALDGAGKRRHDDGAGLGLEERVDDGGLLASNVVVQPVPCLGVDRLADAADDAEGAEVGVLDVRLAQAAEEAHSSRRGVEVGDAVPVDGLPEARGSGVGGGGLKDGGGDTVGEGAVDEVAIAKD